jgi:hypothetical protein
LRSITIIAAGLLLGAAPVALAQPAGQGYGQGYGQGSGSYPQSQQWVPSAPPPGAPSAPDARAAQDQNAYGQDEAAYQARMRQYQHEKHEYDRQRAAYDAQFGGGAAYAYAPPPPPPAPPAPPQEWRRGPDVFRFSETMPFHEGPWVDGDHGARWYRDRGCRLAAPRDAGPDAMIPVCPDADGRYRPA